MKRVLSLLPLLSIMLTVPLAAQDYPNRIAKVVVPFPAGGSTDILARTVAQKLNESYGQLFIVENRAGATGTIGGAFVAKSPADGYTLIMHSASTYTAGYLYRNLSYDAATAFAPVINLVVNPFIIVASTSLPVKSITELIALARRRPNELTYATVGLGSGSHLATEMFTTAAGIKTVAVAYKGSTPAMIALASGETGFATNNILDTQSFIKQGKMRALATTGAKRSPAVPDAPTLIEAGIPVEANLWTGLFATGGTPNAIVNKLNQDIARFFDTPQMKEWLLANLGGEYTPNTPEQFAAFLVNDSARWKKIVEQTGLRLD
jgi:tripartite-type tricarboxylate transporter receptor subunit TctC